MCDIGWINISKSALNKYNNSEKEYIMDETSWQNVFIFGIYIVLHSLDSGIQKLNMYRAALLHATLYSGKSFIFKPVLIVLHYIFRQWSRITPNMFEQNAILKWYIYLYINPLVTIL